MSFDDESNGNQSCLLTPFSPEPGAPEASLGSPGLNEHETISDSVPCNWNRRELQLPSIVLDSNPESQGKMNVYVASRQCGLSGAQIAKYNDGVKVWVESANAMQESISRQCCRLANGGFAAEQPNEMNRKDFIFLVRKLENLLDVLEISDEDVRMHANVISLHRFLLNLAPGFVG